MKKRTNNGDILLNKDKAWKKNVGILLLVSALVCFASILVYTISVARGQEVPLSAENDAFRYIVGAGVKNVFPHIGNVIAIFFLKKLFGISSLLLLFAVFHHGFLLLFGKKILKRPFPFTAALFLTMLISTINALIFYNNDHAVLTNLAHGTFGYLTVRFLKPHIGMVGISVILTLVTCVFVYLRYNLNVLKIFGTDDNIKEDTIIQTNTVNVDNAVTTETEKDNALITESEDEIPTSMTIVTDENITPGNNGNENDDVDYLAEYFNGKDQIISQGSLSTDNPPNNHPVIYNGDVLNEENQTDTHNVEMLPSSEHSSPTDSVERPQEEAVTEKDIRSHYTLDTEYDPTLDLPDYRMPSISLLNDYETGNYEISDEEIDVNRQNIRNTLHNYSIEIQSIKATVGPTITLYEIVPAPGVRIAKIKNLEDDIALSLAAIGIRIIAPIPGRGTIGIEVPNSKPQVVAMKSVLSSVRFLESKMELPVALGKTIQNETYVADLTKMPHLLVAGATGQGKSVGLNAIITSLLYKKHPAQLKFVMVDPKKVELPLYAKIERHFLAKLPNAKEAIITDTKNVVNTLNSLILEMDERYNLLKDSGVRNIKEYNSRFIARRLNPEKGHRFLPYIVVVIDEFADLIMTAGREVETPLTRLAQLARAIGIHLIIATQRPSVNIITGTIKANFPARLAFRVVSKIDSRTILDMGGADQLIGRGDMLYSNGNDLTRLQCAFVDTDEVEKITEFIGSQHGYPTALILPEYNGDEDGLVTDKKDLGDRDPLFEEAATLVVTTGNGSTSNLQRKMNVGFNRAGRIMDQLEAAGIVGPTQGSKPREIYVQDEIELNIILGKNEQEAN